jgi:glycosyltransferase involved in cell wall biosynthesis
VDEESAHLAEVVALRRSGQDFNDAYDDAVIAGSALESFGPIDAIVGHDVLTGELALAIGDVVGAQSKILICHMAYGHYIAQIRSAENAKAKALRQKSVFSKATHVFGVGPKLTDYVETIRRTAPSTPVPEVLLPPLLERGPVTSARTSPRLLFIGRIEEENDAIKQSSLAARAFGMALKPGAFHASAGDELSDATVDIYGFGKDSPKLQEFHELISLAATHAIPTKCLPYDDSRENMLDVISDSSVLVMPSSHEGFGLVAWEAMSLGVPIVASVNSGFFKFVNSIGAEDKLGSLKVLVPLSADDEVAMAQISELARLVNTRMAHPHDAHERARLLRQAVAKSGRIQESHRALLRAAGYKDFSRAFAEPEDAAPFRSAPPMVIKTKFESGAYTQPVVSVLSSAYDVQTAVSSAMTGAAPVEIVIESDLLKQLKQMSVSEPDEELKRRAAVNLHSDQKTVDGLLDFLKASFEAITSVEPQMIDFYWTENERAEAFGAMVPLLGGLDTFAYVKLFATVSLSDAMPRFFRLWLPKTLLMSYTEGRDPVQALQGYTLHDLWPRFSKEIVASYLREWQQTESWQKNRIPPPVIGDLAAWFVVGD